MMKILWVNPSFLDYRVPVYQWLNKLSGGNFYILFSKNRVPERVQNKIQEAIGSHAIPFEGERRITFGKLEKGMANKSISFPVVHGLYDAIKDVNADIIIAEGFFQWTPFALLYAFLHKKPLLIDYERTKWTERECPKWRTCYRKIINKFIVGYLCNGLLTKEYLTDVIGVDSSKIVTGTMSADSEHLSKKIESLSEDERCRLKTELGLTLNGITYIYTGQIVERKGLKYVLDVWETHRANHKDDKLLIIGEGELLEPYKEKYEDNNGIVFTGPVCYDDIYKYYGIADVLIIPTLEDNWSLVVPEAMACGLPVATSIYNGCYPELCNEGINGKTFDPFQREEVIDTLEYFHHVNLKEFGLASKKIESQYNHESAASKIYEKCNEVFKTRC